MREVAELFAVGSGELTVAVGPRERPSGVRGRGKRERMVTVEGRAARAGARDGDDIGGGVRGRGVRRNLLVEVVGGEEEEALVVDQAVGLADLLKLELEEDLAAEDVLELLLDVELVHAEVNVRGAAEREREKRRGS